MALASAMVQMRYKYKSNENLIFQLINKGNLKKI
jgi:hypothetical protein